MRERSLSELVDLMAPEAVELVGDDAIVGPDVVIDSRAASPGALFVAIPGERVDGHEFAVAAVAGGARGVLGQCTTNAPVGHLLAENSVQALSALARGIVWEARARGLVSIGVTGSSGKTSTKDLLAQILERVGSTVAPVGSQNNEVGVPLTACRIDDETRFLVSEMGSRGIGHIAWLTSLVGLDIGVCLNVGSAHVGEFGDLNQTALAKSELVADLAPHGWAVLNANDPRVAAMREQTLAKIAWFGEGELPAGDLQVSARDVTSNALSQASFTLVVTDVAGERSAKVNLRVSGRQQVPNALAAAAAAIAAGVDLQLIAEALSAAGLRSRWRMELVPRADGVLIVNDAYNANPDSMSMALRTGAELLAGTQPEHPGARLVAVLGDMLELGPLSDDLHEQLGRRAAAAGVSEVLAVGQFAARIVAGALAGGIVASEASRDEVTRRLKLGPGDVVLIKGSRGVGLESVAAELAALIGEEL